MNKEKDPSYDLVKDLNDANEARTSKIRSLQLATATDNKSIHNLTYNRTNSVLRWILDNTVLYMNDVQCILDKLNKQYHVKKDIAIRGFYVANDDSITFTFGEGHYKYAFDLNVDDMYFKSSERIGHDNDGGTLYGHASVLECLNSYIETLDVN